MTRVIEFIRLFRSRIVHGYSRLGRDVFLYPTTWTKDQFSFFLRGAMGFWFLEVDQTCTKIMEKKRVMGQLLWAFKKYGEWSTNCGKKKYTSRFGEHVSDFKWSLWLSLMIVKYLVIWILEPINFKFTQIIKILKSLHICPLNWNYNSRIKNW